MKNSGWGEGGWGDGGRGNTNNIHVHCMIRCNRETLMKSLGALAPSGVMNVGMSSHH